MERDKLIVGTVFTWEKKSTSHWGAVVNFEDVPAKIIGFTAKRVQIETPEGKRSVSPESLHHNRLSRVSRDKYEGFLTDGRVLCVLADVFVMNKGRFPEDELYNPQEWITSADGENCWIEPNLV